MVVFLQIVVYLCFGVACSLIAKQRGRSPVGWFFVGLFASCVGLILVLVLPDLKKQQAEVDRLRAQNRLLKERLDKDRMVADQRHGEVEGRLRAHDRVIGIDTAPVEARAELLEQVPPPPPSESEGGDGRQWFYAVDSREQGPIGVGELRPLWNSGEVGPDTLVWSKGMQQWARIQEVPGLSEVLRG
ncbi:MAG TPA: DUF4339 domain-containing protein [Planctomycetota bacterium]|nr:DUF4339 domain-containing protein [Planctomycetota bacterium]